MATSSLHLCTSDSWGGLELYACTLMAELRDAGNEVLAICRPKSKVETYLRSHGIRFTYLPSYSAFSISSARFVRSLIDRRRITVVHTHFHRDIWPASLALFGDRERKLFMSIYMGVPPKRDVLHRFIYGRVTAIFTSSEELNRRLPQLYPVPSSKIHLLPYGRRTEKYVRDEQKRRAIRSEYSVAHDDVLVGTMLRIDPGKGVMDFAEGFLYISTEFQSRVRFMIVGEPTRRGRVSKGESPYEPRCEAYLKEIERFIAGNGLQERIILTGFQDDLTGFLSAFDVFVFPSRDELYSLVVLDAMSMGLPIVAARAGGNLRQVADGVNGLLYDVADSRDLAAKLEQYLIRQELRQQHGTAARRFVETSHDMDRTIRSLVSFYQNPNH